MGVGDDSVVYTLPDYDSVVAIEEDFLGRMIMITEYCLYELNKDMTLIDIKVHNGWMH